MKKIALFFSLICAIQMNAQTWQVGNTTLTESDLVTGLSLPWEMVWGPDDFIWSTTRVGKVLRIAALLRDLAAGAALHMLAD